MKRFGFEGHYDHFDSRFRINDLGFLFSRPNKDWLYGGLRLSQPDPWRFSRKADALFYANKQWTNDGLTIYKDINWWSGLTFRNYWFVSYGGGHDFERALVGPFAIIPGSGQAKLQPILREDAARCIVDTIGKPELLGHIVELGGPEVVTYENIFDWFLKARNIKKAKLKLPVPLLVPAAVAMETLSTNPPITPDEVNMIQVDNLAAGIDSVSSQFGWRPSAPSSWAPVNWAKRPRTGR